MKRNMYKMGKYTSVLFLLGMGQLASAQVGIGTTTPDASAQLQIESTTKGLLIPRVASTSDVVTPATGLIVYQTGGTPGFYYNSGTAITPVWLRLTDAGTAISGAAGGDLSGTYPNPTVAIGAITSAKILDGTIANADISANAITTSKVADGTVTTAKMADSAITSLKILTNAVNNVHIANGILLPAKLSIAGATTGQALTYNGTAAVWSTIATGATGAAGGDLSGTYPNPTVANSSITSAKILDGTIANADISTAAAIAYSKLNLSGSVATTDLSTTGATTGQALVYNGTTIGWAAPTTTGAAGGDLSGTYPNPTVAIGAITSAKILDGTIANADLSANAITTSKVADGTVTTSKMADSAITSLKILTNAVNNVHIADGVLNPSKLNTTGATTGQSLTYNGTTTVWSTPATGATGTAGGDLSGTYPNPTVAIGAITSAKILDGTIANADISANAITTSKVADGTVTTAKMADSAITSLKILTNAVNNVHIANGILLPAKLSIAGATTGQALTYNGTAAVWSTLATGATGAAGGDLSGTYPNPTVANSSITSAKILDGTIANADISTAAAIAYSKLNLSGSVATTDLSTTGATTGQTLTYNGTTIGWASPTTSGTAGGDLAGTYPNPTVATGAITSAKILDGTIVDADIATGAAIAYAKLNLNNSIINTDITANAITTSKVANGTVTTSKMADSAISSLKILTNAVNNYHIANGILLPAKLSSAGATSGQVLTYNGSAIVWGAATAATTSYGFANATAITMAVVLGGTNVPLASNQRFNNITVDGTNTSFTVNNAGVYRIDYNINTNATTTAAARLLINGTSEPSSYVTPSTAVTKLQAFTILTLAAGDVINLQMYGLIGSVTLQAGQGAGISIQKL
jgi:hypothetical protein